MVTGGRSGRLDEDEAPGTGGGEVSVAEEKKNAGAEESPEISASQQSGDNTKPKKDQEHFVNKHQDELIQRVVNVAMILYDLYRWNLLIYEKYNIVRHIYTSQDQMRQLFWYMGSWRDEDKDQFLESLRRHNPDVIRRLEGPEHFVDKHQEELIQRVDNVAPILDDLYQRHLLPYEQYNIVRSIITSHGQMRQLYWYMGSWRDEDKDRLLESLRRHNPELIRRLEEMKELHGGTVSDVSSTKTFAAGDKMAEAIEQPDVETQGISDKKYRVEVESMFHCQETGIKFGVETRTIIEYSLEYGDDYMTLIQDNGYELLGPIFNVRVLSGRVSAVYLPHYVCLDGFLDKSLIKFGDFKDGKLTLKIPTRIESSYVVLENPTFSPVAPVGKQRTSASGKKRRYPFNGMVFLYFRVVCPNNNDRAEYRIHLYLIPVGRCHIKNLTEQKEKEGFQKISKPPQTRSVYADVNYIIRGEPDADIEPKTLELKIHKEIEKCPYTEINFSKKAISQSEKPIILCVIDKKSSESEPVWRGRLTRADIEELAEAKAAQKGDPPRSFIDEHFSELVQRVDNIMPVLDELKEKDLLTGEQYNTVESQTTAQEKMRKLLRIVDSWSSDDKETFNEILKSHNKSNIKKIEKAN
ncbi:NACHT, LRR and PYD domains-containing protein 1a-like [Dendropsophus ebraccatus]|uniref:NACHT, LRR and PYD domains-containing protein 1a-like n=1 Tax=Dendropsophus ebraccatus TaxID=150705 RepID=UPI00383157C8